MSFQTKAGRITAEVKKGKIKVKMIDPVRTKTGFEIKIGRKKVPVSFTNTGVPHTVLFVKNLPRADVVGIGRAVRYHHKFMPQGTNTDFVKVNGPKAIAIRTYERGVEDETLACGSGACACAVISAIERGVRSPVKVLTHSGEELIIYFSLYNKKIKDVYLEGKAEEVFSGEVVYV
jgi:diaminopimelate epimerase